MIKILCLVLTLFIGTANANDQIDALRRAIKIAEDNKINLGFYCDYADTRIARYDCADESIYINLADKYWDHPVEKQKEAYACGWFSSNDPDHVMYHEIGHALLRRRLGFKKYKWMEINNKKANLDFFLIKDAVSEYANWNDHEFFAEVHAGLKGGNRYPEDIMQEYNKIWNQK